MGGGDGKRKLPALDYPCLYRFRVIGAAGGDFPAHVRSLVGRVIGPVAPESCSVRPSSGGRYESVVVNVHLTDEETRRAIYRELWEDGRVVFFL